MIKTFRGILADGGQDRIRLSTIKGKVGYRIVKFKGFPSTPGITDYESTLMIWEKEQTSVSTTLATTNFTESDLLAAYFDHGKTSGSASSSVNEVVFDYKIFNQDIYITHTNTDGSNAYNYYIELEVIPLSEQTAEYTTIKDLRSKNTIRIP
jgi:aminoglycoside phosphotransferase family enzyme